MGNLTIVPSFLLSGLVLSSLAVAQDHEKLQTALGDVHLADGWIYEDIAAGYAEAKKTGKPLLVSFR